MFVVFNGYSWFKRVALLAVRVYKTENIPGLSEFDIVERAMKMDAFCRDPSARDSVNAEHDRGATQPIEPKLKWYIYRSKEECLKSRLDGLECTVLQYMYASTDTWKLAKK